MNTLLISYIFKRDDCHPVPYGISCLISAFRNSLLNNGSIESWEYDLNQHKQADRDFTLDLEAITEQTIQKIKDSQVDVVGFSNFAWSDKIVREVGKHVSEIQPKPIFIMGGAMVYKNYETMQKAYPWCDFFIASFGEDVFADLAKYVTQDDKYIKVLPDFTKYQSPYLTGVIPIHANQMLYTETKRGCLYGCTYCNYATGLKEIKNVQAIPSYENFEAITILFSKQRIKKINLLDPLFNCEQKEFTKLAKESFYYSRWNKIAQLAYATQYKTPISMQIRGEDIDASEFLHKRDDFMKCCIFEIGVQSFDPDVMRLIGRGSNSERIKTKLKVIKRALPVKTEISLIYGLPKQTIDSFQRDIDFLQSIGVDKISAFPLQINPNTVISKQYERYGLIARPNSLGILQVCDNPTHDFDKMHELANLLKS